LASPVQPFVPKPIYCAHELPQTADISVDAEVVEVPNDAPLERGMLFLNG
jgi:hypothetical protein